MKRSALFVSAVLGAALSGAPASAQVPGIGGGGHPPAFAPGYAPVPVEHAGPVGDVGPIADIGPIADVGPGCVGPRGYGGPGSPYGWNPLFRTLFFYKRFGAAPAGPPAVQGTLVFPNHPFARSPRDYFMLD